MNRKSKTIIDERLCNNFYVRNCNNQYYEIEFINDEEYKIQDHYDIVSTQKLMGGLILPVVILCRDLTTTNVEILKFIGQNKNSPFNMADAFVISSISQKILGNFYLKIIKPERPTQLFANKEDAYKWIEQFFD